MTNKDWKGNKRSTFAQLGASNHSEVEREVNDFYATDPESLRLFLNKIEEDKDVNLHSCIWECACGQGHLSKVLEEYGYAVKSTDLIDRGYGKSGIDFLKVDGVYNEDILTNPPFKYAEEFVYHAMDIIENGYYCIMFLKIQFLEGKARRKLFEKYPPKYVYVNSERQTCYINGDMSEKKSSASCYCWFVWQKGYCGDTIIKWL